MNETRYRYNIQLQDTATKYSYKLQDYELQADWLKVKFFISCETLCDNLLLLGFNGFAVDFLAEWREKKKKNRFTPQSHQAMPQILSPL